MSEYSNAETAYDAKTPSSFGSGGLDAPVPKLASSLGSLDNADPYTNRSEFAHAPSTQSPLAQQSYTSPIELGQPTFGTTSSGGGGGYNPTSASLESTAGLGSALDSNITSAGSLSGNANAYNLKADTIPTNYNSTSNTSELGNSGLDSASSNTTYGTTKADLDSSSASDPTSTSQIAPGGVVKSDDHVTNLITAIGGVTLAAPLAAYEALSGHASNAAAALSQKANEQGLTGAANNISASLSQGVSAVSNHPAVQSATAQLSNMTAQASDAIQSGRVADIVSTHANNASSVFSSAATSATQAAQSLGERTGLVSPVSTGTETTSASSAPTSQSNSAYPTVGSNAMGTVSQPGSASYGEGVIGSESSNSTTL